MLSGFNDSLVEPRSECTDGEESFGSKSKITLLQVISVVKEDEIVKSSSRGPAVLETLEQLEINTEVIEYKEFENLALQEVRKCVDLGPRVMECFHQCPTWCNNLALKLGISNITKSSFRHLVLTFTIFYLTMVTTPPSLYFGHIKTVPTKKVYISFWKL